MNSLKSGFVSLILVTVLSFLFATFLISATLMSSTVSRNFDDQNQLEHARLRAVSCLHIVRMIFVTARVDTIHWPRNFLVGGGNCTVESVIFTPEEIIVETSSVVENLQSVNRIIESGINPHDFSILYIKDSFVD